MISQLRPYKPVLLGHSMNRRKRGRRSLVPIFRTITIRLLQRLRLLVRDDSSGTQFAHGLGKVPTGQHPDIRCGGPTSPQN